MDSLQQATLQERGKKSLYLSNEIEWEERARSKNHFLGSLCHPAPMSAVCCDLRSFATWNCPASALSYTLSTRRCLCLSLTATTFLSVPVLRKLSRPSAGSHRTMP